MAVNASQLIVSRGNGADKVVVRRQTIYAITPHPPCWGIFQRAQANQVDGEYYDVRCLIRYPADKVEVLKAFVDSPFFRALTQDKFKLHRVGVGAWVGDRLVNRNMRPEDFVELRIDGTLGASRMITAGRWITKSVGLMSNDVIRAVPKDLLWLVIPVLNAIHARSEVQCDGAVTMYPTTDTELAQIYLDRFDGDNDGIGDVYEGDLFNALSEQAQHCVTEQMMGRILSRTDDQMEELISQKQSFLFGGYEKDEAVVEDIDVRNPSGNIITIGAPITDTRQPGERELPNNLPRDGGAFVELLKRINALIQ